MFRSKQNVFVLLSAFLIFICVSGQASAKDYLFQKNKDAFKADINKVGSRSYKFLTKIEPGKDAKELIVYLRDMVKKAATDNGFKFNQRKKGEQWRFAEKRYLDTPNRDLFKKGYVVRETYRFTEGGQPDPDKFVLTVKEMSPSDFMSLVNSKLAPVAGSDSLVKFEENISLNDKGKMQAYFESTIGSKISKEELGQRTLGDYGKLYPGLLNLDIPADTMLEPVTGYSVQIKYGSFTLVDGSEAKGDIEVWTEGHGGKLIAAEISFDGEGYDSSDEHMKAEEDFFVKIFGEALKDQVMPNSGPYMGSKVRVLFDEKHAATGGAKKQ